MSHASAVRKGLAALLACACCPAFLQAEDFLWLRVFNGSQHRLSIDLPAAATEVPGLVDASYDDRQQTLEPGTGSNPWPVALPPAGAAYRIAVRLLDGPTDPWTLGMWGDSHGPRGVDQPEGLWIHQTLNGQTLDIVILPGAAPASPEPPKASAQPGIRGAAAKPGPNPSAAVAAAGLGPEPPAGDGWVAPGSHAGAVTQARTGSKRRAMSPPAQDGGTAGPQRAPKRQKGDQGVRLPDGPATPVPDGAATPSPANVMVLEEGQDLRSWTPGTATGQDPQVTLQ